VVHALTDDELKRLIRACQGKSLVDRRDEAIVRLMLEAGLRAGEVVVLQVSDVDVSRGLVTITRDKGGKGRIAPFGPQTAQALDRYLRVRRSHRLADAGAALVTRCGAGRWAFGGAVRFAAAASTALSTSMCRSRRGGAVLPLCEAAAVDADAKRIDTSSRWYWGLNALDHLEQCKRHDEARVAKMRQTAWTPINGHLYRLALLP
jgi:integrase